MKNRERVQRTLVVMARSAVLIPFVIVLSLIVYTWDRVGPGINFGVGSDSRYYVFVARCMLNVVILRVPAYQSAISDTTMENGPEYMSPMDVRGLHAGLGVAVCSSFAPRRFWRFDPQSYSDPAIDPGLYAFPHFSSNPKARTTGTVYSHHYYGLPLWILLVIAAVPVAILIARARRQHQRKVRGWCLRCGYNLTGNTSAVCPECGEPISGPTPCAEPKRGLREAQPGKGDANEMGRWRR